MNNILVIKNIDKISISCDGRKLIIDKNNPLFNELYQLDKEQIKEWYNNRTN